MDEEIRISFAHSRVERAEVLRFIETEMAASFGCAPPPTHGTICVAWAAEMIVGTLASESACDDEMLPLEERYEFNHSSTPFPFVRSQIIVTTRWLAKRKGVSFLVLRETSALALDHGKRFMLIEAKPYAVERLNAIGAVCLPVEGARLLIAKTRAIVGEAAMRYFEQAPSPSLYMMDLTQIVSH